MEAAKEWLENKYGHKQREIKEEEKVCERRSDGKMEKEEGQKWFLQSPATDG